jgi:glycogen synthase
MKILFLSRQYPPETGWGGIGSCVFAMAHALTDRGHEVHVLSCVRGQNARDYQDGRVWLHRRDVTKVKGLRRIVRSYDTANRLETALTCWLEHRRLNLKFDVIEAPDYYAEGLALSFVSSRRWALVVHLHGGILIARKYNDRDVILRGAGVPGSEGFRHPYGLDRGSRAANFLERLSADRADVVTAPSRMIVSELAGNGWLTGRETRIIRTPIDLRRWDLLPSASDTRPLVLAVGRVEALKAPEVLVRAVATLAKGIPEVEVVFIGRSNGAREGMPYKEWVINLSSELHAPCRFIDHVPRDHLSHWYGQARVVAMVSNFDNFPMAALEAMAASRPIVCTDRVGTKEIIHGDAGAIVPVGDPVALAGALRPYLLDPARALAAGKRAREIVEDSCSPERVARERESCYRQAIEDRTRQ